MMKTMIPRWLACIHTRVFADVLVSWQATSSSGWVRLIVRVTITQVLAGPSVGVVRWIWALEVHYVTALLLLLLLLLVMIVMVMRCWWSDHNSAVVRPMSLERNLAL